MLKINDFIKLYAKNADCSQNDARFIVQTFIRTLKQALCESGQIGFLGFGTFKQVDMPSRERYDINSGKVIHDRERTTVKFSPHAMYLKELDERRERDGGQA